MVTDGRRRRLRLVDGHVAGQVAGDRRRVIHHAQRCSRVRHGCAGRRQRCDQPWAAKDKIAAAGLNGAIASLSTDGTQIYGTGYAFGAGAAFEGTFAADPNTGAINWVNDCLGDTYDSFPMGQVLYTVAHKHNCSIIGCFPDTSPRSRWQKAVAGRTYPIGTITNKDAYGWDFTGMPYTGLLHWYPDLEFGTYTRSGRRPGRSPATRTTW